MRQSLAFIVNSVVLTAAVNFVIWWFFGTVTVTAQIDNFDNIEGAIVEIDGQYVGDTPYTDWLVPGYHTITVLVDGVDTNEAEVTWYLFGLPWSTEVNAEFTTARL